MLERAGVAAELGFKAHPHMLRHATGYALANKGHDTRALQAYLGHPSCHRIDSRTSGGAEGEGISHHEKSYKSASVRLPRSRYWNCQEGRSSAGGKDSLLSNVVMAVTA